MSEKERYMTMTEIGKYHNQTSHVIGRWLTRIGLRENGQPTKKALEGGFCKEIYDIDRNIWFYVWHAEKTLAALENLIQECMKKKENKNGK